MELGIYRSYKHILVFSKALMRIWYSKLLMERKKVTSKVLPALISSDVINKNIIKDYFSNNFGRRKKCMNFFVMILS